MLLRLSAASAVFFFAFSVRSALADPEQRQNDTGNDQNGPSDGLAYSPPFYPSPWMDPEADGWQDAYAKAHEVVAEMTLLEKVNLTTGVG